MVLYQWYIGDGILVLVEERYAVQDYRVEDSIARTSQQDSIAVYERFGLDYSPTQLFLAVRTIANELAK